MLEYILFEGWSFMYKEVRDLDTSGQLWTILLITRVGTLFYAAVSAVEIAA